VVSHVLNYDLDLFHHVVLILLKIYAPSCTGISWTTTSVSSICSNFYFGLDVQTNRGSEDQKS
jgi:hypothetical protein